MIWRILHDEMTQTILPFIINDISSSNQSQNKSLHFHG